MMKDSLALTILISIILLILTVAACDGNANAEPTPPAIHYGEDVCEFCGMIVSEERYAAGYITRQGETHIFDDIGDMIQSHVENEEEATALFVHDYNRHTWIRAETAHYARSPDLPTPMLSGLAAFPMATEAEELIDELGGQALSFDALLSQYRSPASAGAKEPHTGHLSTGEQH